MTSSPSSRDSSATRRGVLLALAIHFGIVGVVTGVWSVAMFGLASAGVDRDLWVQGLLVHLSGPLTGLFPIQVLASTALVGTLWRRAERESANAAAAASVAVVFASGVAIVAALFLIR